MTILRNPETITAVNRHVQELSWYRDVSEFLTGSFPEAVRLNEQASLQVDIVKHRELDKVKLPDSRSAPYVASKIREIMPLSFFAKLEVPTTGAGYFKREDRLRVPLIVKLATSSELVAENDAVFEALSGYGLSPDNNHAARFNIIIGSVALIQLSGKQKQELQYGINDRLPTTLELAPGRIMGRSSKVPAHL